VQGHGGAIDQFRDRLEHFSIQGSHWSGEWGGSLPELLTLLSQAGAVVTDLHLQRQSLEEFFVDQVRAIEGDRPVSA
jgi:ABC-2 type transport system ATP-binding protein